MSNTDRIEQILREHHFVTELQLDGTRLYHCEKCCGTKVCVAHSIEEYRAHLATAIDAELHPVIETVEQLDALPHESVVLLHGPNGGAIQKRYGTWHWANDDSDDSWSSELESFLPARVLYTPEADR